jgi:dihydropteroate synthase
MDKVSFFSKKTAINCKGKFLNLNYPIVMGILNLTPDSFYDGGKFRTEKEIINRVEQMLVEGASVIDIGAVSTRPGAEVIDQEEEKARLLPVIILLRNKFPKVIFSVDTYRSAIADIAVNEGVSIINDISGGNMDEKMFETIARLNVPYIISHIQGTPENMQHNPYYKDVVKDVVYILSEKADKLKHYGLNDIIIDPGFGFGKTTEQNFTLLKNLKCFSFFDLPLLVGLSRKSMINKTLNIDAENALNATSVLNTIALLNGANILRVHDVKEAMETIKLIETLKQSGTKNV